MSESAALRRAVSATLLPGFVGTTLPDWVSTRLRDGLGGVCIFGTNIVSTAQLRELTDSIYAANPRAIIAIDEEGGDVTRLHYASGSPLPGNAILGRIDDLEYTESIGRRIGWELRRTGFNLNFAPDADINSNPNNPVIGVRSFGSAPDNVSSQVAAWTRGLQSTAVAACAKHFPGHGDTSEDSHLALPVVDRNLDELRDRELLPFAAAIAAGTKTIMSSHIMLPQLDPERPATLSRPILQDLLRGELGFDGVIVSDALDMAGASGTIGIPEAAVRALDAGCDLLCIGSGTTPTEFDGIEEFIRLAITEGRLATARVEDAAARVLGLADELESERSQTPIPEIEIDPIDTDSSRAQTAFEVQPVAVELLAKRTGGFQLVSLDTAINNAIGQVPWGLAAELAANPSRYEGTDLVARRPISVTTASGVDIAADPGAVIVVVGRDIHRHPDARAAVDQIRAGHPAVVVVDMGWPADDRNYADIATFGASRLAGRALAEFLTGAALTGAVLTGRSA
jgi:beta-N-acetylhexosaminidase